MKFRSYVGEEKKENGRNNAGEWKRATNKRLGVTIFMEFVSKRIHRAALMEAFSEYGRVLDVCIAYYNKKRYSRKYTFAFVRFARWEDAAKAVVRGNNRRMDGFHVKVYFDKKYQESCGKGMVSSCRSQQELASTIKYNSKVVKGRSFKDALLGITIPEETGGMPPKKAYGEDPIELQIAFSPSESEWLKNSFVGQVKGMYSVEIVQEELKSEGFNIKVCYWSGFYVIIQCLEEEQVQIFWDLRQSLMDSWFDDIDTVDNFLAKKKLKIWINIEGLPMAAWHATVIESIASKWGIVISIDADTLERNKFDYAQVLLGVSSITDVPKDATVVLNGDKFFIRMSSSEFEDNRCWINGGSSVDSMDEEDSCRFEDLPREFNEVEAEVSQVNGNIETDPKKLCIVGSPWTMENSGGTKLKDSKPQEVLETNEPKSVDHWNDVPIADGSNLFVPSSGFTLTQSGSKVIRAPQNYSSPRSTTIEVNVSASEGVAVKEDELEIEATKCLEVCNVSELYFKASAEEI
ncbi:hypothetical protein V6N11_084144 [Hibiscus sabdariffa]|uniref:Uncharacterized protein n=2 Tax=Hibiscus sabdariffa TaxID=183260 RepID=A0ABR1ZNN2_9ROSI